VPIPFSIYPNEYLSNLRAVTVDPLTAEEMEQIAGIDKNNRLIKGQVFLWEGARDWRDLWDLDGKIAS
jgi:alcohol dehydrogenase (NADP+)